jgi:transcriptional regulator PpsR
LEDNKLKEFIDGYETQTKSDIYTNIISEFGDINIILDTRGKILQIKTPAGSILKNLNSWINKNIYDFLTIESKEKLNFHLTSLSDLSQSSTKWFELNHISENTGEFPVKYKGFKAANKKNVILIGNDLSPVAEIQKKFVNSQLALEREYSRYRSFETKYKALIEFSEEPLFLLDGVTGKILNLNDSAAKIINEKRDKLVGTSLSKFFNFKNKSEFIELLKSDEIVKNYNSSKNIKSKANFNFQSSIFRAENEICIIVRLQKENEVKVKENELNNILNKFYDNTRYGIVFTDSIGTIKYVNDSFISLCKIENQQLLIERPFSDFLARGIIDMKVLIEATLENGSTMPFKTQLISNYDIKTEIEITSTKTSINFVDYICFLISHRPNESEPETENNINENVVSEKATKKIMKLVGSAPLKDLVADTSDIVEKICIETALKMTKNNRVATAEMLNLSRQSLYVKLRKYNLL